MHAVFFLSILAKINWVSKINQVFKKKNMPLFYGFDSTVSKPLQEVYLLPLSPGMRNSWYSFHQPQKDEGLSQPWSHSQKL